MKKIVLISCVSMKLPHKAKAQDLYVSPLFRMNLAYAKSLKPDAIYILSAKHGVLELDERVSPYDETLNTMSATEVETWARKVERQLRTKIKFDTDKVIFLAGEKYRKHLLPLMRHAEVPMKGLGIGKQLHFLKKNTRLKHATR